MVKTRGRRKQAEALDTRDWESIVSIGPIEAGKGKEPITEDVLSDVHARIDGLKAQFAERQRALGANAVTRALGAIALVAAGAALALALPNRDAASEDDLKTLSDQVSSLQQQLAGQEHSLQSRIDAAVKKVERKTRPKASRDPGRISRRHGSASLG